MTESEEAPLNPDPPHPPGTPEPEELDVEVPVLYLSRGGNCTISVQYVYTNPLTIWSYRRLSCAIRSRLEPRAASSSSDRVGEVSLAASLEPWSPAVALRRVGAEPGEQFLPGLLQLGEVLVGEGFGAELFAVGLVGHGVLGGGLDGVVQVEAFGQVRVLRRLAELVELEHDDGDLVEGPAAGQGRHRVAARKEVVDLEGGAAGR